MVEGDMTNAIIDGLLEVPQYRIVDSKPQKQPKRPAKVSSKSQRKTSGSAENNFENGRGGGIRAHFKPLTTETQENASTASTSNRNAKSSSVIDLVDDDDDDDDDDDNLDDEDGGIGLEADDSIWRHSKFF